MTDQFQEERSELSKQQEIEYQNNLDLRSGEIEDIGGGLDSAEVEV